MNYPIGINVSAEEPDPKKFKRKSSVEPLENKVTPLPDLPDELKKCQEKIDISAGYSRIPTPPDKPDDSPKSSNSIRLGRYKSAKQLDKSLEDIIDSELSDPVQILKLVRTYPNVGFLYMSADVDKSSIKYNPYNVK